ncbi:MAG: hypothetical protein V1936_04785 [Patescibacteria group bacterium]
MNALKKRTWLRIGIGILLGFLLVRLVARAWISDDAFITLRVIDNFVHGFGLRWNVVERVQVFTHPLWLFLLTPFYFLTREAYFTTLSVSFLTSCAALALVLRKLISRDFAKIFVLALLFFSHAFLDFATSGLENPLTNLLFALFVFIFFQKDSPRKLLALSFVAALATVNRLDTILLFVPVLLWEFFAAPHKAKAFGQILLGYTPLILWEFFALIYFGFPFPNTFYAKLATGIAPLALLAQGGKYLIDSFIRDPLTLATIFAAFVWSLVSRSKKLLGLAAGLCLYLIYILKIGGDFMSGRFLAPLFFGSVILLGQIPDLVQLKKFAKIILLFAVVGWGINFSGSPIAAKTINDFGIADEREFFESENSLFAMIRLGGIENHSWAPKNQGECHGIRSFANVGIYGFLAPRDCVIIDEYALTDAFLARLPATPNWRIGHFARELPTDYLDSLSQNKNLLTDSQLQKLFTQIQTITRGPIWSVGRWQAIRELNF